MNNISVPSLPIEDGDAAPFDYFSCFVENRQDFGIVNNNQQKLIYITYQNQINLPSLLRSSDYADLAIKCCDDSSYWTANQCQSVPKCSTTLVTISKKCSPPLRLLLLLLV